MTKLTHDSTRTRLHRASLGLLLSLAAPALLLVSAGGGGCATTRVYDNVTECDPGATECGEACVDTQTDPAHCGDCNNVCQGAPNAAPMCVEGSCSVGCVAPYMDCNLDPADGCEADTATSWTDCGACGLVCPTPAHAAPACVAGACGAGACDPGHDNCDGDPSNGCEAELASDDAHCGACGASCSGSEECVQGACVLTGCHGPLSVLGSIQLDPSWSANVDSNYHPQGLTYDEAAGNFVLALQGAASLRVVSLDGALEDTIALQPSGQNVFTHMTGIAADDGFYYLSDYTCNSTCADLFRVGKAGGAPEQISAELEAFGGYPLALGGGRLFRGELITNTYDWTSLRQIRVSDVATPDVITATLATPIARGIGDLTWDGSALWALAFSLDSSPNRNVDLYRIDPGTGAILETHLNVYAPPTPFNPSGLAYADGSLYVLDYSETSAIGSTLTRLGCN